MIAQKLIKQVDGSEGWGIHRRVDRRASKMKGRKDDGGVDGWTVR